MKLLQKYNKFTDHLNEEKFSYFTVENFKEKFSNKQFDLKNTLLYRGVAGYKDIIYYPGAPEGRKPRQMSSILLLLLNNLDSWKKYPDRTKSLLCSTSETYAENFALTARYATMPGSVYVCIPNDGAVLGIVPSYDINSERGEFEAATNFVRSLTDQYFIITGENLYTREFEDDWKLFVKKLDEFNNKGKCRRALDGSRRIPYWEDWINSKEDNFMTWFESKMKPENLGFSLKKYKKNLKISNFDSVRGTEVYFSDGCWLIKLDIFQKLVKEEFFKK